MRNFNNRHFNKLPLLIFTITFTLLLSSFNIHGNTEANEMVYQLDSIDDIDIVAHRGASGYAPENTMAAFEKAVQMNADFIEFDVQLTKDNHLVVIHDETLSRTSYSEGRIREYTYDQLKNIDVGRKYSKEYSGESIPTLDEVITAFYGKIGLLIELKNHGKHKNLEEKVAKLLKKYDVDEDMHSKIIVQSFDKKIVKRFHKLMPGIPTAVLLSKRNNRLSNEQIANISEYANYLNLNIDNIDKYQVERIHLNGLKIMAWTVKKPSDVYPLVYANVDGIITKYPDILSKKEK